MDEIIARYGASAMRHFAERLADLDPDLRRKLLALALTKKPAIDRDA